MSTSRTHIFICGISRFVTRLVTRFKTVLTGENPVIITSTESHQVKKDVGCPDIEEKHEIEHSGTLGNTDVVRINLIQICKRIYGSADS